MLSRERPDHIHVAFDDHRLVANAGLLLPVTLAYHLGLGALVDHYVGLGDTPVRANASDKMLTLVASALSGGDRTNGPEPLRADTIERVPGCVSKVPSKFLAGIPAPRNRRELTDDEAAGFFAQRQIESSDANRVKSAVQGSFYS